MKNILPFLLFFALITIAQAQGKRYYVHAQAAGANTGLSWTNAFTDLQTALQLAQAGDEVWVAEGTYKPAAGANRAVSFEPVSGVRLYGGFAGTETTPDNRDWAVHPAVLSGDIGLPGDSTDNSYNVVYLHQPDSNTVLDGFVVRDGVADAPSTGAYARGRCGAGLYIMGEDWEAYPEIRNCSFIHNTAKNFGGGAMVNGRGDGSVAPQFIGCQFEDNRALSSGGGLAWFGASWVEREKDVYATVFERNYAGIWGGGLYFADSDRSDRMDIGGSEFRANTGINSGGGVFLSIGRSDGAELNVYGTKLIQNKSNDGAAGYISPSGFLYTREVTLTNCEVDSNYNLSTGTNQSLVAIAPIFTSEFICNITYCVFKKNFDARRIFIIDGGGGRMLYLENTKFLLNDINDYLYTISYLSTIKYKLVSIFNNQTGAIADISQINTQVFKNCLCFENSIYSSINYYNFSEADSVFFKNCNFFGNKLISQLKFGFPDNLFVYNTTLSDIPDKEKFLRSNNKTYIAHSAFDSLSCAALPANVTCGPGILVGLDPMFVNPDSGDFRLQPCSPLIDAGNNAFLSPADSLDLAGLPRIRGAAVDIGAYEAQGPALAAAPLATPSCPGGASGAVEVTVQDACPPVSFQWQSGAAAGTGLSGLTVGTYQFTLTDARGQNADFIVEVPAGPAPDLSSSATPVVCGDTLGGSASATLAAGARPFTYAWAGSGSADSLRSGLPAGAYPLTVTDAQGCSAAGTVEVSKSGNLSVDIDIQSIGCPGGADGAFTVLPLDGKAPFVWHWADGSDSPTLGPLGPGDYLGTLTDALGCTIGWILPLDEPQALHANAQSNPASDSSSADGSIALSPSGGSGPYEALWSNGASGFQLDSLAAGSYTVTLTDAHGCTAAETISVGVVSGVHDTGETPALRLYPNPTADRVWVVAGRPFGQEAPLRVVDGAGRVVWEGRWPAGAERVLVDTANWPAGVYAVQVGGRALRLIVR